MCFGDRHRERGEEFADGGESLHWTDWRLGDDVVRNVHSNITGR